MAANSSAISRSSAALSAAVCGLTSTFGSSHNGLSAGSGSVAKTSSAAKPMRPSRSACRRASSSTTVPRPTLTRTAPGRTAASTSGPMSRSVAAVPGKGPHDRVHVGHDLGDLVGPDQPVDVIDGSLVAAGADHGRAQRGQPPGHLGADPAQADDQHGHLVDLAHLPTSAPRVVALLCEKPRQVLGPGQHAEDGELGERAAVHPGGGAEDDPAQLRGTQPGRLDRAPPPAAMVCTQRRPGLLSAVRFSAAGSTSGMP